MQTTASGARTLQKTLDNIVTDDLDGGFEDLIAKNYFSFGNMSGAFSDELENGGPGVLGEKNEAEPLDIYTIEDGAVTRYRPRKFGGGLRVSMEMNEDGMYNDKYIAAARRLKRALKKTIEYDCANVLNRAANTAYTGGDGQPLASASHTIPVGGTFSNTLSVAMSPSMAALVTIRNNVAQLPGHDGLIEGYDVEKVVFPTAQWGSWETILKTSNSPGNANNDINVVRSLSIKPVEVKYWTGSTTNWGVITDAPDGLKFKWRMKPKSRSEYTELTEVLTYLISARWDRKWTDPRGFYFSAA